MITQESINKLATQYHTSEINVAREYFQHLFLSQLYRLERSENMLFKGGTALRIVYGSPRFSEDLDFSVFHVEKHLQKDFIENLFGSVLAEIEKSGVKVRLGPKPGSTVEGYYGDAIFEIYDHSVLVSINVSGRNGRDIKGEVSSVANDFVPTYNVFHLPQDLLVEEKVFEAMLQRKKARDFYDLYFIIRKGLLSLDQKSRLNSIKNSIIVDLNGVNIESELSVFLPQDQQAIIKDFKSSLTGELNRQLSGV